MLLLPVAASAQDYPTEEGDAVWAEEGSGEKMELLLTEFDNLVAFRDADYCRSMAYILRAEVDDADIRLCAEVLAIDTSHAWIPESYARLFADVPDWAKPDSEDGYDLGGVISLRDSDARWKKGKPCRGKGGYDDIRGGMQSSGPQRQW